MQRQLRGGSNSSGYSSESKATHRALHTTTSQLRMERPWLQCTIQAARSEALNYRSLGGLCPAGSYIAADWRAILSVASPF